MAIREITQGVSYIVRRADKPLYLGKMGRWYSDIRLASVYAGPREATMAGRRTEFGDLAEVYGVAIELLELVQPVNTPDEEEEEEAEKKPAPKPPADNKPAPPPKPPAPAKVA